VTESGTKIKGRSEEQPLRVASSSAAARPISGEAELVLMQAIRHSSSAVVAKACSAAFMHNYA